MKVGVIGLGSMGQNHARILSEMGFLEGVADNVPIEFDMRRVALKKEEPLKREIRNFLESVDQGSLPLVTGQSVTMTLKIAEAALRSMNTGSRQAVR